MTNELGCTTAKLSTIEVMGVYAYTPMPPQVFVLGLIPSREFTSRRASIDTRSTVGSFQISAQRSL